VDCNGLSHFDVARVLPVPQNEPMKLVLKDIVMLVSMLLSAVLGYTLHPRIFLADELPPMDLVAMVPSSFGEWREDANLSAQVVNPEQQTLLDKIYSQTLSRSYVNHDGYRVMLSIAYGKNQTKDTQLHKPEICYPAQGFKLLSQKPITLNLLGNVVRATRLETELGARIEPLIYWTVEGDRNTTTAISMRLAELSYAARNRIPDGMLVRISSIDKATDMANQIQRDFASDLIAAIAPATRRRFLGIPTND